MRAKLAQIKASISSKPPLRRSLRLKEKREKMLIEEKGWLNGSRDLPGPSAKPTKGILKNEKYDGISFKRCSRHISIKSTAEKKYYASEDR